MSEKDRDGSFILSSQVELRFETQCIDLDIFIKENLYSHDKKKIWVKDDLLAGLNLKHSST